MQMADISKKDVTRREAIAEGRVYLKAEVIELIKKNKIPKGNVLEAAQLSGILAAKKTPELIPLCHPLGIESMDIKFSLSRTFVRIETKVAVWAKTGSEMEALTATVAAALTIYDMCKPLDKDIVISEIKLLKKTGGKSGTYVRK